DSKLPVTVTISEVSLILNNNITPEENKTPMIKTNQIGYRPNDIKIGFVTVEENIKNFSILNESGETVLRGKLESARRDELAGEYTSKADFSNLKEEGKYTLSVDGENSYIFSVAENVYDNIFKASYNFFYLQRCGFKVEDPVFGHEECHKGQARIIGTYDYKEADGGWHDAGDYGRYIVTGAKATADLLLAWEASKDNFDNQTLISEAKWELDWMLKMQREDGGVYHKITCKGFPGFVMPEEETEPLFICPVSTPATADFAGIMAMAYSYLKTDNNDFANICLEAAKKAWNYLETHGSETFKNPSTVMTGEYGDPYDKDERYFAAAALFEATGEQSYIEKAKELRKNKWKSEFGWEQMEGYGDEIILKNSDHIEDKEFVKSVKEAVLSVAEEYADTALNKSGYGIAYDNFVWGSNGYILDRAHLLSIAADMSGKEKYKRAARSHLDYVLGNNPMGICYVTGFGTASPQQPHHRPSVAKEQVMEGMLVGGPDQGLQDPFAENLLSGKPPMKCWVDHFQSYSTNEIAINWNSALVYSFAKIIYGE
ncbi:MAG: glycoside hydrolase family 9 protein, partial [Spirochaetales bacterium]|nr:glycoside hydrolase family 9 protein [Spirochaetales bacterium]